MAAAAYFYGPPFYNFRIDSISDLQAVKCGIFQGHQVCSPLHNIANLSVALAGLLLVGGTLLARRRFPANRRMSVALYFLIIGGLAALANAFTPEDVTLIGDTVTAFIVFLFANFGLIQVGRELSNNATWRKLGAYSEISGIIGVVALILDGVNISGPLGSGIEWIIVAPVLIWMLVVGTLLLVS
jgi:hypothetical protein